ncbi:hypothetical protein Mgra_00004814 [Meloidogyne graminicola]|uniref:Uncharacterized protein n=1 Tax=Meloidogyne graminicola TaxID=189291 RepID=A0A8S9ZR63_9BILA|nr:hypothetical protein Mgra_00004814 [Meloidogyne graminicola]
MFIKCSINDVLFDSENNVFVIKEKNVRIYKLPLEKVFGCNGILFCYPSQLTNISEGKTWKPSKAYEVTKKGNSKLCINSLDESTELYNFKNIQWNGFIVFEEEMDLIIENSKEDKEYINAYPKPLFNDFASLLALKWDLMIDLPKNIETNNYNRLFFWKQINKCNLTKSVIRDEF